MIKIGIVGGGPAGIHAALLLRQVPGIQIDIFERGDYVENRNCPREITGICKQCPTCSVLNGIAGGGAGSDGKFLASRGGVLYKMLGDEAYDALMNYTSTVYRTYGDLAYLTPKTYGTVLTPYILDAKKRAEENGLFMELHPITHYGSDGARKLYYAMEQKLEHSTNVSIHVKTKVVDIDFKRRIIHTDNPEILKKKFDRIILAPGRGGSDWFYELCKKKQIPTKYGNLVIGVRAEVPDLVDGKPGPLVEANKDVYEPKLRMKFSENSFVTAAKTFCQCPGGRISYENYGKGYGIAANGHSLSDMKSPNTNVSLLLDINSKMVKNPEKFLWKYLKKANDQSGGFPIVQTLRSLAYGIPSTYEEIRNLSFKSTESVYYPGDFSEIFEPEMISALITFTYAIENVFPGFTCNGDILFYGPEIKPVSVTPVMDEYLQIYPGIHVAGDGVNTSHGLGPASGVGIYVALMTAISLAEVYPELRPHCESLKRSFSFLFE